MQKTKANNIMYVLRSSKKFSLRQVGVSIYIGSISSVPYTMVMEFP